MRKSDRKGKNTFDCYLRCCHIVGQVEARCDTDPSKIGCFWGEQEFPCFLLIEVERYEGKRDVLQRERGLRKPKVSLSLTQTHSLTHTETNHGRGGEGGLRSQDRNCEKEIVKETKLPVHHHSTDTYGTRWPICHLVNVLLTAHNLHFTPGSTLPASSVECYRCIFNCWHIRYTPGVCVFHKTHPV